MGLSRYIEIEKRGGDRPTLKLHGFAAILGVMAIIAAAFFVLGSIAMVFGG